MTVAYALFVCLALLAVFWAARRTWGLQRALVAAAVALVALAVLYWVLVHLIVWSMG